MSPRQMFSRSAILLATFMAGLTLTSMSARAEDDRLLASFDDYPSGTLVMDKENNIYGVTTGIGKHAPPYGTAYKLAPDGTLTTLHHFDPAEGFTPEGGLLRDKNGDLYGTTLVGGNTTGGTICDVLPGCGTVFKLSADGHETVLHKFSDKDGAWPRASLIEGEAGNLYGPAPFGGNHVEPCRDDGCGVIFSTNKETGKERLLYAFAGGTDGANPIGKLYRDAVGNIFGTTYQGGGGAGCYYVGCGTIFELSPEGAETILYSFQGGSDGTYPASGLARDKDGNFYGTTFQGGAGGCGTVFKLASDGTLSVLHAFSNGTDGLFPVSDLLLDQKGNLYGTASAGGVGKGKNGVVFKLAPNGTYTVLHAFAGGPEDAGHSSAGLIQDKDGNLYGESTKGGASKHGAVFTLKE